MCTYGWKSALRLKRGSKAITTIHIHKNSIPLWKKHKEWKRDRRQATTICPHGKILSTSIVWMIFGFSTADIHRLRATSLWRKYHAEQSTLNPPFESIYSHFSWRCEICFISVLVCGAVFATLPQPAATGLPFLANFLRYRMKCILPGLANGMRCAHCTDSYIKLANKSLIKSSFVFVKQTTRQSR